MIDTSLWFMFPVGIVIATIAMMAGIGGAVLYSPFFILVLQLNPLIALGAGLAIEFFSFTSGVIGYLHKKVINFAVVKRLIIFTVPATIIGVILGRLVPTEMLKVMLALLLVYLAYEFLLHGKKCIPKDPRCTGVESNREVKTVNVFTRVTSMAGGLLVGMISAGLGEINEYNFLKRMNLPVPAASGTSVFLIAMSAAVGVASHGYFLVREGDMSVFTDVASLLVFTVPGVIIGAQIGVALSGIIKANVMSKFVGALFLVLGVLTFVALFRPSP